MKLYYFKKAYKSNFIKKIYYRYEFFVDKRQNGYSDDTLECS